MSKSPLFVIIAVMALAVAVAGAFTWLPVIMGKEKGNQPKNETHIKAPFIAGTADEKPADDAPAEPAATPAEPRGEAPALTGKIAYVNSDSLLTNYAYYKKLKGQLEQKAGAAERDMEGRLRKLENDVMSARQKAESGGMSQQQMMETEQNLMRRQQEIGQYRDKETERLMNEERKMTEQLNKSIKEYLRRYSQQHGYDYILGYSNTGGVLYANERNDITSDVLRGLNEEYKAKAGK